ncbi:hypothetical protein C8Q76DRAFT_763833, partial [Earliella scabrosa]
MKFTTLSALTLAAAFAGVHAQSSSVSSPLPTSTAGLTPCILSCVTDAASANGCQGPTDFACVCTNLQFQQQARACLQDSCSQGEVQAAEALQSQQCAAGKLSLPPAMASSFPPCIPPIFALASCFGFWSLASPFPSIHRTSRASMDDKNAPADPSLPTPNSKQRRLVRRERREQPSEQRVVGRVRCGVLALVPHLVGVHRALLGPERPLVEHRVRDERSVAVGHGRGGRGQRCGRAEGGLWRTRRTGCRDGGCCCWGCSCVVSETGTVDGGMVENTMRRVFLMRWSALLWDFEHSALDVVRPLVVTWLDSRSVCCRSH